MCLMRAEKARTTGEDMAVKGGKRKKGAKGARTARWIGAALLALMAAFLLYCTIAANTVAVRRAEVFLADLPPAFDGYRIAHLSDLHISAAGDVEPCVFAHYANANIHDATLLDALRSPLFMAYRAAQPFDENLLRPCPILDNPGKLAELVEASGAVSTNPVGGEEASALCEKCRQAAEEWEPVADRLWGNLRDPRHETRADGFSGQADTDIERLSQLSRLP